MTRDEQIAKRLRNIPETQQNVYKKASQGKGGARNAIKAFCSECVGYDRLEVTLCTDLSCPLYLYRPYRNLKRASGVQPLNEKSTNSPRSVPNIEPSLFQGKSR